MANHIFEFTPQSLFQFAIDHDKAQGHDEASQGHVQVVGDDGHEQDVAIGLRVSRVVEARKEKDGNGIENDDNHEGKGKVKQLVRVGQVRVVVTVGLETQHRVEDETKEGGDDAKNIGDWQGHLGDTNESDSLKKLSSSYSLVSLLEPRGLLECKSKSGPSCSSRSS